MDDEESLRTLGQNMLERLGYKVETVKDGLEAIETYKKDMDSGKPFDAVVLDLTIKGGVQQTGLGREGKRHGNQGIYDETSLKAVYGRDGSECIE